MWLRGVGTRRRPCASRHGTHDGAPCLGAGALEEALEEATTEMNEPPTHREGGVLSQVLTFGWVHTFLCYDCFR